MTNHLYKFLAAGAAAATLFACQKADPATKEKLDKVVAKLDAIEKKLDTVGTRGGPTQPQGPRPGMPDPTATYAVPIDGDPTWGPANAKVTIVEAADFACPFCSRVSATVDELKKSYGENLRVVWKNLVVHPQVATDAALAACAAGEQGKFFEFEKAIWEKGWEGGRMKDISAPALEKFAAELKLDVNKYKADVAGQKCKDKLAADQKLLAQVGARGTPSFFINGRYISGAQPIDSFKKVIDEEMKKADDAIKAGTKAEDYYSSIIVGKGKKSVQ